MIGRLSAIASIITTGSPSAKLLARSGEVCSRASTRWAFPLPLLAELSHLALAIVFPRASEKSPACLSGRASRASPGRSVKLAVARDHADSARQRAAQSRPDAAALSPIAQYHQPGCRAGETVLEGNIRGGQAVCGRPPAARAGGLVQQTPACVPRRHPLRGQDCQRVRAVGRGHSQGQVRQAQQVRKDGEAARSRKSDHRRLIRGLRSPQMTPTC